MEFDYSKLYGKIAEKFRTQSRFAKEMGMSKERIRQIKIETCKKLKDMFTPYKKRVI